MIDLKSQIESIIFASPDPIKPSEILDILEDSELTASKIIVLVDELIRFHDGRSGGLRLVHCQGGGFQFQTPREASILMEKMFSKKPRPLSRAAQETLAIIAYRQPVTRWDVEFIRGVEGGVILKNLLEKNLIQCVGRKDIPGKPMLFGTTEEFLKIYQLQSLAELPPLEAFQPGFEMLKNAFEKIEAYQEPANIEPIE